MTSGGSRRRECLKPAKKQALRRPERCAAPVQPCLSPSGLPLPEGKPERFSRLQVFGTGTLPVGFQGRSALVAEGEIPVQETCTRRKIIYFYDKLDSVNFSGYIENSRLMILMLLRT